MIFPTSLICKDCGLWDWQGRLRGRLKIAKNITAVYYKRGPCLDVDEHQQIQP